MYLENVTGEEGFNVEYSNACNEALVMLDNLSIGTCFSIFLRTCFSVDGGIYLIMPGKFYNEPTICSNVPSCN